MSDEIQAIANNNFILHNIDAKKLYVQEPLFTANSGDAVYVGWRPDETVLWSGETINWSAQTVNLSDNIYNYDRIRLEYYPWATQDSIHCIEFVPKSVFPVFSFNDCFIDAWNYTSATQPYMTINSLHYTSGTLTVDKNWIKELTATNWSERNDGRLLKVVGINRKENA